MIKFQDSKDRNISNFAVQGQFQDAETAQCELNSSNVQFVTRVKAISSHLVFSRIFPRLAAFCDLYHISKDTAAERAKKIFRELDVNGDGELTADEFVRGCMDDPSLVRLLNSGGVGEEEGEDL
mgnify:CR=1 FL=1